MARLPSLYTLMIETVAYILPSLITAVMTVPVITVKTQIKKHKYGNLPVNTFTLHNHTHSQDPQIAICILFHKQERQCHSVEHIPLPRLNIPLNSIKPCI